MIAVMKFIANIINPILFLVLLFLAIWFNGTYIGFVCMIGIVVSLSFNFIVDHLMRCM